MLPTVADYLLLMLILGTPVAIVCTIVALVCHALGRP
jgi:hypothetical protein